MTEDEYVAALIAQAPPLSAAQIAKLAALFDQELPDTRRQGPGVKAAARKASKR